jgi:hypothetical protein
MNNWDSSLIEKIFAEKEQERSEDRDNLLRLTSQRLYGEKIHYVLELIQNAEDEASSSIIFMFNDDNVVIINNGRPFDEEDVWGICSVRSGKKKNKIGFFGIGFKSVFNVTKKPQIISNKFNFEIESYIYPKPKTSVPENLKRYYSPKRGAIFVLPYSSGLPTREELIENFNSLDDKILLFLENLEELKFIDNISSSEREIRKKLEGDSKVSLFDTQNEEETKWRVFHRNIQVDNEKTVPEGKEGIKETQITIAFPIDSATRDTIKKSGVVYCYLPTKKRTDLPFLIQADFLPTIGRENISDHPWNVWLMKELGTLAADAIDEIKDDEQICDFLYDFIPLPVEIQDDLIRHLYTSLFETLKEKEIAKTTKGWLKPENCVIPDDDRLRDILTETDLKLLLHEEVFYIDHDLSEKDHFFTRAENVLFELGAKKIGSKEVVDFLQEDNEIRKKNKEWFLNLYDCLRTTFDTGKKSYGEDFPWDWDEDTKVLFEELEKANFILTDDEELVSLKDPKIPDRLICYPQMIDLSEVHQLFTEGEIVFLHRYFQESGIVRRKEDDAEAEEKRKRVKEWFDSIGVKKYFKQAHIIKEVILPKFTTGKYREYDDLRLYKLIDYIRTYWSTIESEIKNKKLSSDIIEEIKGSLMLKAFRYKDGNKIDEYRSPCEIYFSKRYGKSAVMEDLFEGIEDIYFLSTYYLNREKREIKKKKRGRQKVEYTWKKFFEILGVWSSPIVNKDKNEIDIGWSDSQYKWVERESSNWGHKIEGDCKSPDMEKLIELCSKSNNKEENQRKMELLWESLSENWKRYKDIYCSCKYKWHEAYARYWSSKTLDSSSFLEFLRSAHWILGEDRGFYKPNEIFTDIKRNRLLLENGVKYTNLKANETFLKDLEVRIEPKTEEVIDHIKAYREKNPHPEENKIEKMKAIYDFLQDRLNGIEDSDGRDSKIKEIKGIFNEYEILYLPREDKAWWKPTHIFWRDFSDNFETLRGYIEHNGSPIYDDKLKNFFLLLDVVEKPLLKECFDILEELKANGNLDYYKKFAPKIYTYINEVTKQGVGEAIDWDRAAFLSEKGQFLSPHELYYSDDDEYKKYFETKVEILWLPFSGVNIKNMLQIAGFKNLSQNISVGKKFGDLNEVEGDTTNQLIQRLFYVGNYLKKKKVGLYAELQKEGVFKRIKELQAYETPKIVLDYVLKIDNPESVVINNVEKEAYLSNDENRIYKLSQINLFSTAVAKELSKLFAPGGDDVFPLLDSLFGANGEEELNEKLRQFGIQITDTFMEEPSERVKLIPSEEEVEQEPEPEKKEEELKPPEEPPKKPQPPIFEPDVRRFDLIDPDEFVFDTIEEHTPYIKTDGMPNVPTRTVKLKKGHLGTDERERKPRKRVNRVDAEVIALEIVMRFEEIEGREPDDRHKQKAIGYDIYSNTTGKEERFIEVKHFRGEAGTWELTPHQWKKAEQEEDKYFVYVVSGLREGNNPIIEIIQNPIEYLTPDPPVQKKFSNWKNGVIKVIKSQRV